MKRSWQTTSTHAAAKVILFVSAAFLATVSSAQTSNPAYPVELSRGVNTFQLSDGVGGIQELGWEFDLFFPQSVSSGTVIVPNDPTPKNFTGDGFSGLAGTRLQLDTQFPTGTYQVTVNDGATKSSFSVLDRYAFAVETPYFTGNTVSSAQNFDIASPFTLTFTPFTLPQGADSFWSFHELDILDSTAHTYVARSLLDFDSTSYTVPANTFVRGHTYTAVLVDSAELVYFSDSNQYLGREETSIVTQIFFTVAAVPEPTSAATLVMGFGLMGLRCWRLRKRQWHAATQSHAK